ncbi:hypothetical protein RQP46_003359 [Phenoliferia psychrophenolica]
MAPTPTHKLNSGYEMPVVGLGCWMGKPGVVGENQEVEDMVTNALKVGYTHFDTANGYGNEEAVGRAIRNSGVARDGWNHHDVAGKFQESLDLLGLDYIDLFLVHFPMTKDLKTGEVLPRSAHPNIQETWADMEALLATGKVRSIGVSNFSIKNLEYLLETAKVVPAVNQIESHICWPQQDVADFCASKGIFNTAHCPLGQYQPVALKDEKVASIAQAHSSTPAQILLSWSVQRGNWSVVPKSSNVDRLRKNLELLTLTPEEMSTLSNLHKESGKYRSLCDYAGGMDVVGEIMGWTYEELGWDPALFAVKDAALAGK